MKKNRTATMAFFAALVLVASGSVFSFAQDAKITGNARVDHLLSQMTLDEKLAMIHGAGEDASTNQGQAGYLPGVKRLGIPPMRFADGPPGVLTRVLSIAPTSTMGLAATFSREDARLNGSVIGREARSHGITVALQPFINIDRDFNYGRGYNTFGEDPFLTGELGAAEITGIQHEDVMSQAKHFIAYDTNGANVFVDDQTLHEVYAAPFAAAVKAGVSSIMCSYNKVNGPYSCGNPETLTKLLKEENGFQGFVTSDWGAVHATDFINTGLDMEMPGTLEAVFSGDSFFVNGNSRQNQDAEAMNGQGNPDGDKLPEELAQPLRPKAAAEQANKPDTRTNLKSLIAKGVVTEDTITRAAGRVLLQMEKFGYLDGKIKLEVTPSDNTEDVKIVEKTAIDAAVLLKNEGGALPLKAAELDSVVLIGPTALQVDSIGINGERSVGLPSRQVGPIEALRKISGNANVKLAVEDDMTGTTVPASAFSHDGKPGLLRTGSGEPQTDAQLNFTSKGGNALEANSTPTWKGTLTAPHAGTYWLYLQALGTNAGVSLDGMRLAGTGANQGGVHGDILQANQDNAIPTVDGLDNVRRAVELSAGPHEIEVRTSPDSSSAPVQVRLNWYTPEQRQADHDAAIAAAKSAKTAVVFVWTRLQPVFGLPGDQDKLVEEIAAVNPNTVVVLNTSQPVSLPWVNKVKAVLEMWWPGDEGGWSTANLLLGKTSPAGRLPVTWGKKLEDYPATDPKHPERSMKGVDNKTTYSEGVNVGYRWFDKENVAPLFAFGHGLSYATFEYSGLKVAKTSDGGLDVKVRIKNTGSVDSDEVPQVYIGAPSAIPPGVDFPVRALVAFDRIHLAAGEAKTVTLRVEPRQLQYWSTKDGKWGAAAGKRTVSVGASSRDLRVEQAID